MSGLPSPASTREEPLHSVWAGLVRTKGRAKDKVAPALTADVVAMVEALPAVERPDGTRELTTAAKRDRALLLLGFAGALRRSELAALTVGDLAFGADGMRVRLRRSKADQEGAGAVLGHPLRRPAALLPRPSGAGVDSTCCNNGRSRLPRRRPPRQRRRPGARAGVRGPDRQAGRELGQGWTPLPTPGTRSGRGSRRRRRGRGRTSGRS